MTTASTIQLNAEYGSPEDFASAVQELKAAFHPEAISTDPAVLEAHGIQPDGSSSTCRL
jgi:D-lactate dehydrogenase (cytochrome)